MLQHPYHLIDSLQYVDVLRGLRSPKLDTVLQMQSLQCQVEEDDHVPQLAGYSC